MWLRGVRDKLGDGLAVDWKYFSLEQVNSQEGPDWKIWKQPPDYRSPGMPAFRAAEAARRQGQDRFLAFHDALLDARHKDRKKIADTGTLLATAADAGLDLPRFREDLADPRILDRLAEHHTEAVEKLHVFGTPTLVLPDGAAVYVKLAPPPPAEEALDVFREILHLGSDRPYVLELKRPE